MKTTPATAPESPANGALSRTRLAHSVRLQLALEEQQRLDRAARIRQLREESPFTQEALAERVGVKLRTYQKWEEGGGITWEHLETLAEIHEVSVQWIHKGEERASTPDPFAATGFAELSAAVDDLRKQLAATRTELLSELAKVRKAQEAQRSTRQRSGRTSAGSGK